MLKKLLKYDFLSIRRYLIPLILLTPVVSFFAGMISYISNRSDNVIVVMGLKTMFGFSVFALALSVALLPVLLVVRYYMGFYSDSGYLTLMLPASRKLQILSKFLCAVISEVGYLCVAFFSFVFAFGAGSAAMMDRNPFYGYKVVFAFLGEALGELIGLSPLVTVEIVFYLLVYLVLQISILYLGVTLGAVIFQGKGKIWGAILFCFVTNTAVSTVLSLVEMAITGGILGFGSLDMMENATTLKIFFGIEIIMRAGISVGLYFFNTYLTEKKLNLC